LRENINKNMRYLKVFEDFNDDEFEYLANIGKMQNAILKVVEVHEKHYYNDNKISSDPDFLTSIKELINSSMNGEEIFTSDYLSVISSFEERVYGENLFNLNDDRIEESVFGILNDVIIIFLDLQKEEVPKYKSDMIRMLGEESERVCDNMNDGWVIQNKFDPKNKALGDFPDINLN